MNIICRCESLIGNPVRVGGGPAAVTGNELLGSHCESEDWWEGEECRWIREPEDLPARTEWIGRCGELCPIR